MAPNWASGPQNHPRAKVAVSTRVGAAASMGGIGFRGTAVIDPVCPVCIFSSLDWKSPLRRLQAFRKGVRPRIALPSPFSKALRLHSISGLRILIFSSIIQTVEMRYKKDHITIFLQPRVAKGHEPGIRERPSGASAWGPGLPTLCAETMLLLRLSACPDRCFLREPPEPPGRNKASLRPPVTAGLQNKDDLSGFFAIYSRPFIN